MLKLKDKHDNSLLVYAAVSKNAMMFNAVITCAEQHLSAQEIMSESIEFL